MRDIMDWSSAARHGAAAASADRFLKERRWARGPWLRGDILVIPSDFYNQEGATFWKSQGFTWDSEEREWTRSTRLPLRGRSWTAEKWLLAARRKYQEFWPHWERLLVGPAATTGIAQRDLSNDPDADDGPTHIQSDVDIDITERHA